ncbi:hypothetical protein LINGRAHAP2_LOCUS3337 [Linum grandiflorum]
MAVTIKQTIMVMITLVNIISLQGAMSDNPLSCSDNTANETYTNDMENLLVRLQLMTPFSLSSWVRYKVGFVGGDARCDIVEDGRATPLHLCSDCVSKARDNLVLYCKGREAGSTGRSDGLGATCHMRFYHVELSE